MSSDRLRIDVVTIFPGVFRGPLDESLLRRAQERSLVEIRIHDLRDFASGRHRETDDAPYGGGAGMVMRIEPLVAATEALIQAARHDGVAARSDVILLTPQGVRLDHGMARELAAAPHLILLCGRYEGFDERVREHVATREVSIGDYVLTGGEIPALVVIDAVTRLIPGVVGSDASLEEESHAGGLLEYPHYTRPPEFRGWAVPPIVLSGDHGAIARWRREQSLLRTLRRRPDLLAGAALDDADRAFLASIGAAVPAPGPPAARDSRRADAPRDRER